MPIFPIWKRTSGSICMVNAGPAASRNTGLGSSPVMVAWRDSTWLFSCRMCHNHENEEILDYILPRKEKWSNL